MGVSLTTFGRWHGLEVFKKFFGGYYMAHGLSLHSRILFEFVEKFSCERIDDDQTLQILARLVIFRQ